MTSDSTSTGLLPDKPSFAQGISTTNRAASTELLLQFRACETYADRLRFWEEHKLQSELFYGAFEVEGERGSAASAFYSPMIMCRSWEHVQQLPILTVAPFTPDEARQFVEWALRVRPLMSEAPEPAEALNQRFVEQYQRIGRMADREAFLVESKEEADRWVNDEVYVGFRQREKAGQELNINMDLYEWFAPQLRRAEPVDLLKTIPIGRFELTWLRIDTYLFAQSKYGHAVFLEQFEPSALIDNQVAGEQESTTVSKELIDEDKYPVFSYYNPFTKKDSDSPFLLNPSDGGLYYKNSEGATCAYATDVALRKPIAKQDIEPGKLDRVLSRLGFHSQKDKILSQDEEGIVLPLYTQGRPGTFTLTSITDNGVIGLDSSLQDIPVFIAFDPTDEQIEWALPDKIYRQTNEGTLQAFLDYHFDYSAVTPNHFFTYLSGFVKRLLPIDVAYNVKPAKLISDWIKNKRAELAELSEGLEDKDHVKSPRQSTDPQLIINKALTVNEKENQLDARSHISKDDDNDPSFLLPTSFFNSGTIRDFEQMSAATKWNRCFGIREGEVEKAVCYSTTVAAFLTTKFIRMVRQKDQWGDQTDSDENAIPLSSIINEEEKMELVNGPSYTETYLSGFQAGTDYFKQHYGISIDALYGVGRKSFEDTIRNQYLNAGAGGILGGWVGWKKLRPLTINKGIIKEEGYHAGLLYAAEQLADLHNMDLNPLPTNRNSKPTPAANTNQSAPEVVLERQGVTPKGWTFEPSFYIKRLVRHFDGKLNGGQHTLTKQDIESECFPEFSKHEVEQIIYTAEQQAYIILEELDEYTLDKVKADVFLDKPVDLREVDLSKIPEFVQEAYEKVEKSSKWYRMNYEKSIANCNKIERQKKLFKIKDVALQFHRQNKNIMSVEDGPQKVIESIKANISRSVYFFDSPDCSLYNDEYFPAEKKLKDLIESAVSRWNNIEILDQMIGELIPVPSLATAQPTSNTGIQTETLDMVIEIGKQISFAVAFWSYGGRDIDLLLKDESSTSNISYFTHYEIEKSYEESIKERERKKREKYINDDRGLPETDIHAAEYGLFEKEIKNNFCKLAGDTKAQDRYANYLMTVLEHPIVSAHKKIQLHLRTLIDVFNPLDRAFIGKVRTEEQNYVTLNWLSFDMLASQLSCWKEMIENYVKNFSPEVFEQRIKLMSISREHQASTASAEQLSPIAKQKGKSDIFTQSVGFESYIKEEYRVKLMPYLSDNYKKLEPRFYAYIIGALIKLEVTPESTRHSNKSAVHRALIQSFSANFTPQSWNAAINRLDVEHNDEDKRNVAEYARQVSTFLNLRMVG